MALSRLLVLRALGLGDFLTGVPALRALRRAFPDHELILAAPEPLRPLVDLAGVADRLTDTRGLARPPWQGEAPDVAVNLHGRGPQSHRLLQQLRPRQLVAFGNTDAGHEGPPWRAEEHEVQRWCRLVSTVLAVTADPSDLRLPAPGAEAPLPGAVVVHPGAAYPSRRWPPDRFAAVARWAREGGHAVALTGSAEEAPLTEVVRRAAGLRHEADLAGRTDLLTLAAQVASARLVVCGDTGVAHLATAFGTPSVLLFGPTPPSRWGPPAGPHTVLWHGSDNGDPWGEQPDPALLQISVEEVRAAAERLLSAERRTTPVSA